MRASKAMQKRVFNTPNLEVFSTMKQKVLMVSLERWE